jgi:hypothetical protein
MRAHVVRPCAPVLCGRPRPPRPHRPHGRDGALQRRQPERPCRPTDASPVLARDPRCECPEDGIKCLAKTPTATGSHWRRVPRNQSPPLLGRIGALIVPSTAPCGDSIVREDVGRAQSWRVRPDDGTTGWVSVLSDDMDPLSVSVAPLQRRFLSCFCRCLRAACKVERGSGHRKSRGGDAAYQPAPRLAHQVKGSGTAKGGSYSPMGMRPACVSAGTRCGRRASVERTRIRRVTARTRFAQPGALPQPGSAPDN